MKRKPLENIQEYFGAEPTVIIMGLLCAIYMSLVLFAPEDSSFIINILPPFSFEFYIGIAFAAILYQVFTWKKFRLFQGDWYKAIHTWVLFVTEFATILFGVSLLSWPIYFIYGFLTYSGRVS